MAPTGGPVARVDITDGVPDLPIKDEMIIASASSGVALCGTYVGSSTDRKKQVLKQLLLPPNKCKLYVPDQAVRMQTLSFSSIHSSKTFCDHVEQSGWTAALSASIPSVFSVSGGGGSDKNKVLKREGKLMSKEACQMQYWYFPKASFNIPRQQMRLTEEALQDVGRVRSLSDAESFLRSYGSHVSTGRYQLGGVLVKGVTIKAKEATSVESMLETITTNLNGEFEFKIGRSPSEVGVKVVFMDEHSSSSTKNTSDQQAWMGTIVTALGPQTTNDEEFRVGLEDKSTWHIIDSPTAEADLVPVWEIIQPEDARFDVPRRFLLREAWLRSIASEALEDDRLFYLYQRASFFTKLSKFADKDEAIGRLKSKLAGIPGFTDLKESPVSPTMLHILQQCWSVAIQMVDSDTSRWDARQLLFELPEFDHLLLTIAQSSEKDMEDGKQFIRDVIDEDVQVLLHKSAISLKEPVKSLLQKPTQVEEAVTTRLIPLVNISPDELLKRLKDLQVGDDESNLRIVAVVREIKACLHQGMNQEVKSIIVDQGFDGNGDYCDVDDAAKEHVRMIIQKLESHMVGQVATNQISRTKEVTTNQSFPVVPQYTMPPRDVFTLNGGVLVDRPLEISDSQYRNMMDRIRHRIDPSISVSSKPVAVNTDDFESFFENTDERNSTQCEPTIDSSPIKILVNLLMRSDLLAQIALFQLLLEQRYSVPLIVPKETISVQLTTKKIKGFGHLAEALNFVQVKLENQEVLSLVGDTKLLRVVFVSNRKVADACETVDMACKVLNCEFWSKHKKEAIGDGFTVVELGVGFIKTSKDPLHKHRPCLAFCVWGDHNDLEEFLMTIADVVIVELEPKSEEASPPQWPSKKHDDTDILYWNNNSSKRSRKKIATNVSHIWGTFSQMSTGISMYLEGHINTWHSRGSNDHSTTLIDCLHIGSIPPLNEVLLKFSEIDAPKYELKRDSFKLQKSFNTEADYYFKSLSDKRTDFSRKMEELKAERKLDACDVLKLPILRDFLQFLSEKDYVKRRIGIMRFQLSIDKQLQPTLEQASKEEGDLFKKHQLQPDDSNFRAQYYSARKKHVDQMLGLEHLWRELSHIYSAKPLEFKHIPKLAALHLLDGFPLEILDGDATMFQELWVDSVLVNLDTMLHKSLGHKPKIFVLSVVGLQSSGKSTLLNLMFGTQLRTSAGQCTRGVYLQLVKSEWPESDYVLLLDTEGIRSPEYHGCDDAEIKDNRLATFAVLPADACVVVVANEEDNGLKDVLPIVLLAFKGSAMAEKYAGRMQAKLFFVYRSIDTNDVKKLRKNQQKLQEELREAASEISEMRICGSRKEEPSLEASFASTSLSVNPLSNFNIDEDEEKSDVKYLGNLKKGNVPPLDVPDFDYGERVVELRKYIHKRIAENGDWEAHKLQDWSEYLKMVWDCIADANFELGFLNRLEYSRYLDFQTKLVSCRDTVGKKSLNAYEELEQKLRGLRKDDFSGAEVRLSENFMKKVDEACVEEREKVVRILEQKQSQRWKVKETERWENYCLELKKQYEWLKQDCITGVLKFDSVVNEYCMRIQRAVESKATDYHLSKDKEDVSRQQNMKHDFEKLFQSVIRVATEKYPPLATKVPGMVHNMYQKSPIVGEKYKFVKNTPNIVNDKRDKPDDSIGSIFKRGYDFLFNKASGTQEHVHQSLTDELILKIDKCLQYAKQYSDHLVEEVIRLSEETMADHKVANKKDAERLHNLMKVALSEKLQRIQQKWDRTHNVAKRLEQERPRLQQFFESCANRVGGTKTLTLELSTVLQEALDDSFKDYVAKKVVAKVQGEEWIGNWKVMRAHLDLHLLDLIQAKKTDELISCVRDGGSHYKEVLNGLLEKEIRNELKSDLWQMFITSVKLALQTAAISATTSESLSQFLETLVGEFSEFKFFELASCVNIVDKESYSNFNNDIDFLEVEKEVFSKVNFRKDIASSGVEHVVGLVKERMIKSQSENARPRCEEKCPRCNLTCFLAANHDVDRHDTLHQPCGLSGVILKDYKDPLNVCNGELVWTSCSRSVSIPGKSFYKSGDSDELVPYKDFSVHYPTWSLPSQDFGVPEVREYIFAHYQEALVQEYRPAKKCTEIPQEYFRHSIPELRTKQENVLQRFERMENEAEGQW